MKVEAGIEVMARDGKPRDGSGPQKVKEARNTFCSRNSGETVALLTPYLSPGICTWPQEL